MLDESALKRIIFNTAEKKLPKWEFVSSSILNNKISTIQPFKTQHKSITIQVYLLDVKILLEKL